MTRALVHRLAAAPPWLSPGLGPLVFAALLVAASCDRRPLTCVGLSDAGACVVEELHGDCDCRCEAGWVTGTSSAPASVCERQVCRCGAEGTEDLTSGCASDDDCVAVPAGCCGCPRNEWFVAVAVPRGKSQRWRDGLTARCVYAECLSFGTACDLLPVRCRAGACEIDRTYGAGPGAR